MILMVGLDNEVLTKDGGICRRWTASGLTSTFTMAHEMMSEAKRVSREMSNSERGLTNSHQDGVRLKSESVHLDFGLRVRAWRLSEMSLTWLYYYFDTCAVGKLKVVE